MNKVFIHTTSYKKVMLFYIYKKKREKKDQMATATSTKQPLLKCQEGTLSDLKVKKVYYRVL